MYTPWPFTLLFQELKDQVQVFDFSKYNFVTPIMKPAAMDRGELLDGVMNNYRRFYMKKALFHYPWRGTGFRRLYSALVHPDCLATETDCCAKGRGHVCRFEVGRDRS